MTASRRPPGRQRLGQHFLKNQAISRKIAEAVPAPAGSLIVEIGPGRGALSLPLLERGFSLLAIEADPILARDLVSRLVDRPARVVLEDALETDFDKVLSEAGVACPVALASNLPYESATPMIRKFVRHSEWFSSLTVMIQKEVAERLLAPPAGEAYGYLTLDVTSHAAVTKLFDVGPKNFDPPPKVMSTVLSLTPRIPDEGTDAALLVASLGFAHRRKKLINGLESRWGREEIRTALAAVGIPEGLRAEVLSWQNFLSLARALGPPGSPESGC